MKTEKTLSCLHKEMIRKLKQDFSVDAKNKDAFYKIYGNKIPFIPFRHIIELNNSILSATLGILDKYNLSSEVNPLWGIEGIQSMFLKGVNPATAEYIATTVKLLDQTLKAQSAQAPSLRVVEFGTGAGWATLILWSSLQKYGNVTLFTVDNSPYAIASTTLLLDYFDIPYIIIKGEIPDQAQQFKGVVLQFDDFADALSYHAPRSLNAAYSNHGTTYLSAKEHSVFIEKLYDVLVPKAAFVTDSLNPQMRLSLNRADILVHVAQGNNASRTLAVKAKTKEKGALTIITSLYDKPALRFMDLLHFYLFHSIKTFFGYMRTVSESEKAQRSLYERIGIHSKTYYNDEKIRGRFDAEPVSEEQITELPVFVQTAMLRKG